MVLENQLFDEIWNAQNATFEETYPRLISPTA